LVFRTLADDTQEAMQPSSCRLVTFRKRQRGDNGISASKPWTSRLALCYGNARSGAFQSSHPDVGKEGIEWLINCKWA
jgi:hypothetical protein